MFMILHKKVVLTKADIQLNKKTSCKVRFKVIFHNILQ